MIILTPNKDFTFTGRENTSDAVVVWEQFVCNTYGVAKDDLKECKNVFDIGANIGAFSAFVKSIEDEAKIIAFEPEQNNRALLMENFQRNRVLDKIKVEKQAIGGEKKLAYITNEYGSSKVYDDQSLQPVEMLLLDEIFPMHGFHEVGILKLDIEGAEYETIAACDLSTLQKARKIVLEFHKTDTDTFGLFIGKLNKIFELTITGSHEAGGILSGKKR